MSNKLFSLSNTINWVATLHKNQVRKGTDIPYAAHVYGVASLLMIHGINDEKTINAALLHDIVEDSDATLEDIKLKFGETVACYVNCLSEDKSKTWEERKIYSINHINEMPSAAKSIKLADKINSLEMMFSEINSKGIDWDKFNRGYIYQKWYYSRFFQEIRKNEVILNSSLFKYGLNLLKQVFETNLGSKATYKKCLEKTMVIDLDSVDEEIVFIVLKWKEIVQKTKEHECNWPVKYAGIEFLYKNVWYKLYPSDISATSELFECLEHEIVEDLVSFGAEDVFYTGMID